jgi:hypothetical protein
MNAFKPAGKIQTPIEKVILTHMIFGHADPYEGLRWPYTDTH